MPFTYYKVTCDHCDHPATTIGDAKPIEEILRLIVTGEAVSAHSWDCPMMWGKKFPSFTATNETTGEVTQMRMERTE